MKLWRRSGISSIHECAPGLFGSSVIFTITAGLERGSSESSASIDHCAIFVDCPRQRIVIMNLSEFLDSRINLMKTLAIALFALGSLLGAVEASAQQLVRPQWNYQGSAVCPEGYDFIQGWCRPRGGGYGPRYGGPQYGGRGPRGYGGDGVEPRWNRAGSAVCPEGYDFHARSGLCRPQRY
jgi:hypothetical protein